MLCRKLSYSAHLCAFLSVVRRQCGIAVDKRHSRRLLPLPIKTVFLCKSTLLLKSRLKYLNRFRFCEAILCKHRNFPVEGDVAHNYNILNYKLMT